MNDIQEIFGSLVFNETVMHERLPKETYKALKSTISKGGTISMELADVVANAMKDWAIEKGATHFTHWFQPMTGITAEKHDSFIAPAEGGKVIMEFSGKELIKGEPDASSFPSGGLRATFEARGYTAWDATSYAFIKDGSLCIPTAFYSYSGECLDKKTPLLRSMEQINKQALRILRLFGNMETKRVSTTVGPEQEYFLIDKAFYDKRPDLIFTGRTLIGAKPPKGQEMEDHYFGVIRPRVSAFMKDLDMELWKLGIFARTKHNEAAPSQHELAPIFTTTNIACDHNQLTMELMKKVAEKHGLVCLLHEKPFAGLNGSGKHNNWSMATDKGVNIFEPGDSPAENAQFLLFLTAVMSAVHKHQDLLRLSIATAGNDHRLGSSEAPPAIVSMYLGAELTDILESIENGTSYSKKDNKGLELGVDTLPKFPRDTSDRNRTSPFAFTGNKFEFRMLGSPTSISCTNVMINAIVADELCQMADKLEKAKDFTGELNNLIRYKIKKHKCIIFNGNNYSEEWVAEAKTRGLLNVASTAEALPYYEREENIALFEKHHIYSPSEIHSRTEILLENYCNTLNIEASTLISMINTEIIPAINRYLKELTKTALNLKALDVPCEMQTGLIRTITILSDSLYKKTITLEGVTSKAKDISSSKEAALYYRNTVFETMQAVRRNADELEGLVAKEYWPFPTYADMLFNV